MADVAAISCLHCDYRVQRDCFPLLALMLCESSVVAGVRSTTAAPNSRLRLLVRGGRRLVRRPRLAATHDEMRDLAATGSVLTCL